MNTYKIIVVGRDDRGRCEYNHMVTCEAESMKAAIALAEASESIGPYRIGGIFEYNYYLANRDSIKKFFEGAPMSRMISP